MSIMLLNNEEDEYVVRVVDCDFDEYERAEDELLNSEDLKATFCGHLYFLRMQEGDEFRVVEMTLQEYLDYWRPLVEWYANDDSTPRPEYRPHHDGRNRLCADCPWIYLQVKLKEFYELVEPFTYVVVILALAECLVQPIKRFIS